MAKIVTIYTNQSLIRNTLIEAWDTLKTYGQFELFLSFTDPRTNCLVQSYFTFFPKPQPSYAGGGLIADHLGLALRVPSDMAWYSEHQGKKSPVIHQKAGALVNGEYQTFTFKLEVDPNIRVDDE